MHLIRRSWLMSQPQCTKMRDRKQAIPLGDAGKELSVGGDVLVKWKSNQKTHFDEAASIFINEADNSVWLRAECLKYIVEKQSGDQSILVFVCDHSGGEIAITIAVVEEVLLGADEKADDTARFENYDIPPTSMTTIETEAIVRKIVLRLNKNDPDLISDNASRFLAAPHVVVPLFTHVMHLTSEENIKFPIRVKKLADQLRVLLTEEPKSRIHIRRIEKSHEKTWAKHKCKRIAFIDGGAARISGLPGAEPIALRVGAYIVEPGNRNIETRESWKMWPFIVADMIEPRDIEHDINEGEVPDQKRLAEAARYIAEGLSTLRVLTTEQNLELALLHGPLINQFVTYSEGTPYFLPCLAEDFLANYGITESAVAAAIGRIERVPRIRGRRVWNQFMAVYAVVINRLIESDIPAVGVVERTGGRWLALDILRHFSAESIITDSYRKTVEGILDEYDITDDFLFGCILREGEYISPPARVTKNPINRAWERWRDVVKEYKQPRATILKTEETTFPFRIEMNNKAAENEAEIIDLIYHTSRLLPRYAFPVGLDIVDKYAKIPDWLTKGVSANLSAAVLSKALATGDKNLVAQLRKFLMHTPRDFFFRPKA